MKISDDPLVWLQAAIQIQSGPKNIIIFCLILQELCDFFGTWDLLTLFDIPKDVVFAEILFFSNIFSFSAINWALKLTKTVNFVYIP